MKRFAAFALAILTSALLGVTPVMAAEEAAKEDAKTEEAESIETGIIYFSGGVNDKSIYFLMEAVNRYYKSGVRNIWLAINSPGGSVEAALSFYNMTRKLDVKLNTYTSGQASSAATILFLSGKERVMAPTSYLMMHDIKVSQGDAMRQTDLENKLELMAAFDRTFLAIIARETGLPLDKVRKLMNDETYFDSRECLQARVCTKIDYLAFAKDTPYATVHDERLNWVFQ